jgi:hypothetical protein
VVPVHRRVVVLHPRWLPEPAAARAASPASHSTHGKDTTMAARPEVVELLTDFDLQRTGSGQRLVHRDGTPFSTEETDLLTSATDEDLRAAASELAAAPERLAELFMPSLRTVAEQLSDDPPTTEAP